MATMPPQVLNFDINKLSTDEEITLFLGTRITSNVICGLDPFSIELRNSSGGWYLYNSEAPQYPNRGSTITETQSGFWKVKKDRRIFTYTSCVGRKTTMEFYISKVPEGKRTRWMMHKYQSEEKTSNGFYNKKDYNISLYRIFLQNDQTDYEEHYSSASCDCAIELRPRILQEPGQKNSPSGDVLNRSLGKSASSGTLRERLNENFMNDINATWDLSTEGIEINDLCDPEHAELTVPIVEQRQSVDSESQGEDYLELNDIWHSQSVDSENQGEDYLELNDIWQMQSVDSESQGEDYLELNDICHLQSVDSESQGEDYLELNDIWQMQSVDSESQGEDYLELNEICCLLISSNSMDEEGQSTFSESVSEYLNENTVKDTCPKNNISDEEYHELIDLCSPGTSSSSSDNSSRMSIDSYDYFDSGAPLQSIRDEDNLGEEGRANHRFSVSRAAESNQFVIRLPSPGSAHSNSSFAVEEGAPAGSLPENERCHQEFLMSNDNNKRDDSKTGKSEAETNQDSTCTLVRGLKKVAKIAKFGKYCCCFGPF